MKNYKYFEKLEVRHKVRVCERMRCDLCGHESIFAEDEVWKSIYAAETTETKLFSRTYIDGDEIKIEADVCPICVEWIINQITSGRLKEMLEAK